VLQSFGCIKDAAGIVRYEAVQAMLRKLVWLRAFGGRGPASSIEDSAMGRISNIRNDLWREGRPAVLAQEQPVAWEPMTLEQILMTWRAVHAGEGASIDLTEYIPGSRPTWGAWSGSAWVATREHIARTLQPSSQYELGLSLALPPGWDPDTDDARKVISQYGRWITETEYQPPPS
jgi:hypothetical protein